MASSSTESEQDFRSAEEDHVEDQSPDEPEGIREDKKAVGNPKKNQVKGKKVMNVAAKKSKENSGGDGDDEKAQIDMDGKGKAKDRRKANKAINISLRGSASKVHTLFKEMSADSREKFASCCFGHLIGMPPFTVNRTLMCAVLRRYVKWDVFEFDGYDVRCSLRDIALITGLSVTPVLNPIRYDEGRPPGRLQKRYLGTGTVTEYKLHKAIRNLESNVENQECDKEDLRKMHMLYFICVFLLPNSAKNVAPKWIQLAEDFSKFNAHPWGFEVHRLLVDSFSHMFPRLGTPHFNAYGCLHVFTVWCYMHFPSVAPPTLDRVYPRLLAYKLKSRLKNRGGVGNTTLKTYEAKVDKCLKKKNFIVQVEVSPEEQQAYDHHLPTVEDDPVRGSDTHWLPKRSAAIGRSTSDEKYSGLLIGITTRRFKEMMNEIYEGRVEPPNRESRPHVVPGRKRGGVSNERDRSTKKRKTTAATSVTVLRRSPHKHGSSFPSPQSRRTEDCEEAGAGTTQASSSGVNCGQPKKTQGDIINKVSDSKHKKNDPVEEPAEEKETGEEYPKSEIPKESGPENGKEKDDLPQMDKQHVPLQESVDAAREAVQNPDATLSKLVDTGRTRASTSAVDCGQRSSSKRDMNKKVPDSKKNKTGDVEELAEEKELGDEVPNAEKAKESGPENGKEKLEMGNQTTMQGAWPKSVNEAKLGVEKPKESLLRVVGMGASVSHEKERSPSPQSEVVVSRRLAAAITSQACTSGVDCGCRRTTVPVENKKVPVSKKKRRDHVEEQEIEIGDEAPAEDNKLGNAEVPKAEKPKDSGRENGKEKDELEHRGKQPVPPKESDNVAEEAVDNPNEFLAKRLDTGTNVVQNENDRSPEGKSERTAFCEGAAGRKSQRKRTLKVRFGRNKKVDREKQAGGDSVEQVSKHQGKYRELVHANRDKVVHINNDYPVTHELNVNSEIIGSSSATPAEIPDEELRYLHDAGVDGKLYGHRVMIDSRLTDIRCTPLPQRKMTLRRVLGVCKYFAEVDMENFKAFVYLDRNLNHCMKNDPMVALKISPAIVGGLKPGTWVNGSVFKWYASRLYKHLLTDHATPPVIVVDNEFTVYLGADFRRHIQNMNNNSGYKNASPDQQFLLGRYGHMWAKQLEKWDGVGNVVIPHHSAPEDCNEFGHWIVFEVRTTERRMIIYDSKGTNGGDPCPHTTPYADILNSLQVMLDLFICLRFPKIGRGRGGRGKEMQCTWRAAVPDVALPQQFHVQDCGVFSLLYMDLLCRQVSLDVQVSMCDTNNMRYVLAGEFLADGGQIQ